LLFSEFRTQSSGTGEKRLGNMNDEQRIRPASFFRRLLSIFWEVEKSTWRWAAALGLTGAVLVGGAGGFFGYASYGYPGMIAGAIAGAIVGWIVATLIFYLLLSTASFFS
jgi:hypothetical protein